MLFRGLQNIKIQKFSCGDYYVGAIAENGTLYTWGYGNDGQLGHENKSDVKSPKIVNFDIQIKEISCGSGHTGLITTNNELFMVGRGKEGQLGLEESIQSSAAYRTTPKFVETFKNKKVISVKCGGEHTLAIVEN